MVLKSSLLCLFVLFLLQKKSFCVSKSQNQYKLILTDIKELFASESTRHIDKISVLSINKTQISFLSAENVKFIEDFVATKCETEDNFDRLFNDIAAIDVNNKGIAINVEIDIENIPFDIIEYIIHSKYHSSLTTEQERINIFNHDYVLKHYLLSNYRLYLKESLQTSRTLITSSKTLIPAAYNLKFVNSDLKETIKQIDTKTHFFLKYFDTFTSFIETEINSELKSIEKKEIIVNSIEKIQTIYNTYKENIYKIEHDLLSSQLSKNDKNNIKLNDSEEIYSLKYKEVIDTFNKQLLNKTYIKFKVKNSLDVFKEFKNKEDKTKKENNKDKLMRKIMLDENTLKYRCLYADKKERIKFEQLSVISFMKKTYGNDLILIKEVLMDMELFIEIYFSEIVSGYSIYSFDILLEEIGKVIEETMYECGPL